jgi:hypothetical protein
MGIKGYAPVEMKRSLTVDKIAVEALNLNLGKTGISTYKRKLAPFIPTKEVFRSIIFGCVAFSNLKKAND